MQTLFAVKVSVAQLKYSENKEIGGESDREMPDVLRDVVPVVRTEVKEGVKTMNSAFEALEFWRERAQ